MTDPHISETVIAVKIISVKVDEKVESTKGWGEFI